MSRISDLAAMATPAPWVDVPDEYGLVHRHADAAYIVALVNTAEAREAVVLAARNDHRPSPNVTWKPLGRCACGLKKCPTLAALVALDKAESEL